MKLDRAIEILDSNKAPPLMHPESKYNEALKLGIEAMKYVIDTDADLLPGETK